MTSPHNIWEGRFVRLRAIVPGDWACFHRNDQDSEAARLCDAIYMPRSEEGTREWTEKEAGRHPDGDNMRLAIETLDGQLVGTIISQSCDPRNGTFKYGVAIFREHWRRGYASDAVRILLRYFFEELRYEKATAQVYSFNEASARLHERLGFKLEGRVRHMIFAQGRHHDELIYGLLKSEYERMQDAAPAAKP